MRKRSHSVFVRRQKGCFNNTQKVHLESNMSEPRQLSKSIPNGSAIGSEHFRDCVSESNRITQPTTSIVHYVGKSKVTQ